MFQDVVSIPRHFFLGFWPSHALKSQVICLKPMHKCRAGDLQFPYRSVWSDLDFPQGNKTWLRAHFDLETTQLTSDGKVISGFTDISGCEDLWTEDPSSIGGWMPQFPRRLCLHLSSVWRLFYRCSLHIFRIPSYCMSGELFGVDNNKLYTSFRKTSSFFPGCWCAIVFEVGKHL